MEASHNNHRPHINVGQYAEEEEDMSFNQTRTCSHEAYEHQLQQFINDVTSMSAKYGLHLNPICILLILNHAVPVSLLHYLECHGSYVLSELLHTMYKTIKCFALILVWQ